MASFRKRGNRWQVQVRQNGVAASATLDTRAEAQRWARQQETEIEQGKRPSNGHGTLGEVLRLYRIEASKVKPIGRSKADILRILALGLGDIPVRKLTADHLLKYAKARRDRGAGPVTVGVDLSILGTVLRSAHALIGMELSDESVRKARNALAQAGLVQQSNQRDRRPTQQEIDALCSHWRSNPRQQIPMADLLEFGIATAMRREEICRLVWSDVNLENRTVVVRDRKDPRRKIGNDCRVPLLDLTGYEPLAIIGRQPQVSRYIFPYKPDSISTLHARACGALGIDDLHWHDATRHEGLSRLAAAGLTVPQLALVSGHKDWKQLQRYVRLRPSDLVEQFRRRG